MTDLRPKYLARRLRKAKDRPTWVLSAPGPITMEQAQSVRQAWRMAQRTQVPMVLPHGWGVRRYPQGPLLPQRGVIYGHD